MERCTAFDPHAKSAGHTACFRQVEIMERCTAFDPHARSAGHTACARQVEIMERCTAFDPHARSAGHTACARQVEIMERCTAFDPHARSAGHPACARQVEIMECEPGEDPAILQGIHVGKAMDGGFEARTANTIQTAHYLAKERPFSDFAELVAMQERTGSTMPAFYRSDKAAAQLVISGM